MEKTLKREPYHIHYRERFTVPVKPFYNDLSVLFNTEMINEIVPTLNMTYNRRINAFARLVIIFSSLIAVSILVLKSNLLISILSSLIAVLIISYVPKLFSRKEGIFVPEKKDEKKEDERKEKSNVSGFSKEINEDEYSFYITIKDFLNKNKQKSENILKSAYLTKRNDKMVLLNKDILDIEKLRNPSMNVYPNSNQNLYSYTNDINRRNLVKTRRFDKTRRRPKVWQDIKPLLRLHAVFR
jgi:hypothetical protein